MAETISSAANPLVKRMRLLASRKHRREQGAFVVEGTGPIWRAIKAGWPIEVLITDADLRADSRAAEMVAEQEASGVRVARLSNELFERLSSRDGPAGVAAIVKARQLALSDLAVPENAVFVALHRIGNPGNLGTVIRTADATGSAGVILIGDTTDPCAPAAVKASMGSLFATSLAHAATADDFLTWAKRNAISVLATSDRADTTHWNAIYKPPLAILLGSEGEGLPGELLASAAQRIAIPMTGTADSLNLAAAAAVMLYEVRRHTLAPGRPGDGDTAEASRAHPDAIARLTRQ